MLQHFTAHISILGQEFQRRAITVILIDVLASAFNAESKNINLFAGERHDFWPKNQRGTLMVEIFYEVPPLNFDQKKS